MHSDNDPDGLIKLARAHQRLQLWQTVWIGVATGELVIIVILLVIISHLEYLSP